MSGVEKKKAKKAKGLGKSEVVSGLAEAAGVTKVQAEAVLEHLQAMLIKEAKSTGVFTIPGIAKAKLVDKPAKPAREMRNPFSGEMMMSKPKPAHRAITIKPIKAVKDAVK